MSKIDFKCPHGEFSCVHVDTCAMSVEKSCQECLKSVVYETPRMVVSAKHLKGMRKVLTDYEKTVYKGWEMADKLISAVNASLETPDVTFDYFVKKGYNSEQAIMLELMNAVYTQMNKEEAIALMKVGVKMTHTYFSPDEWVTIQNGKMLFEDGCICSIGMFWQDRTVEGWQTGWSVFKTKVNLQP